APPRGPAVTRHPTVRMRIVARTRLGVGCAAMADLAFLPAHALASAVRQREISPPEVMEATLARIARLDPGLGAFVALRAEDAMAEARALAERIARGEDPGPLAGVPFGVKDEQDVA